MLGQHHKSARGHRPRDIEVGDGTWCLLIPIRTMTGYKQLQKLAGWITCEFSAKKLLSLFIQKYL